VVRDPATVDLTLLPGRVLDGVRPLLRLSYWLDHAIWGFQPSGFLLTNLVLHVATVVGVYLLACRRLDRVGALVAGAVFSLQPAKAEVVGWVGGRSTGLATALLVWARAVNASALRHRALLSGGLFACACLAKEVALIFPVLLFAWDLTRKKDEPRMALRST